MYFRRLNYGLHKTYNFTAIFCVCKCSWYLFKLLRSSDDCYRKKMYRFFPWSLVSNSHDDNFMFIFIFFEVAILRKQDITQHFRIPKRKMSSKWKQKSHHFFSKVKSFFLIKKIPLNSINIHGSRTKKFSVNLFVL